MTLEERKHTQRVVGTDDDGFWGRESIKACQKYLRDQMPSPHPFPASDQKSLRKFYGAPGNEDVLHPLDVKGFGILYAGSPVSVIRCHHKIASALQTALADLARSEFSWILKEYEGCYNNRPMRGGTSPSLHAYGAAIDFWSARNGNRTSWPDVAKMPIEIMEIFARQGFVAAGAFWGRDAMHFQATK